MGAKDSRLEFIELCIGPPASNSCYTRFSIYTLTVWSLSNSCVSTRSQLTSLTRAIRSLCLKFSMHCWHWSTCILLESMFLITTSILVFSEIPKVNLSINARKSSSGAMREGHTANNGRVKHSQTTLSLNYILHFCLLTSGLKQGTTHSLEAIIHCTTFVWQKPSQSNMEIQVLLSVTNK